MTICMTMAASKLLLSILRTEYETLAAGEWVTGRQADVEDYEEVYHTASEGAWSAVVAYWEDVSSDWRLFRGSFGLGLYRGRTVRAASIIYATGSQFYKCHRVVSSVELLKQKLRVEKIVLLKHFLNIV
jgi:hypothetical protein